MRKRDRWRSRRLRVRVPGRRRRSAGRRTARLTAYSTLAPGHSHGASVRECPRRVIGSPPVNVADRTKFCYTFVSVRSSVVAAEALALLFSCSFWPERSRELVRDLCLSEERGAHDARDHPPQRGGRHKWPDGLSRETGEAVVRDLLQFEGFRSHDNWMRRPGSWSPG